MVNNNNSVILQKERVRWVDIKKSLVLKTNRQGRQKYIFDIEYMSLGNYEYKDMIRHLFSYLL